MVLGFITSHIPQPLLDSDVLLPSQGAESVGLGLRIDSALRLHRLMTLSTRIIRRELGQVPPTIQAQIDAKLRNLFELKDR